MSEKKPEFGPNGAVMNNPEMTEEMHDKYVQAGRDRWAGLDLTRTVQMPRIQYYLMIVIAMLSGMTVATIQAGEPFHLLLFVLSAVVLASGVIGLALWRKPK